MIKKQEIMLDSNVLGQKLKLILYGNYGIVLLLFPAFGNEPEEYEENNLIDAISNLIENGKFLVASVASIDSQIWFDDNASPAEKVVRLQKYNDFVVQELVPSIFTEFGTALPIIVAGAANGAFHSSNNFFRRPDIFSGLITMSGTFNIEDYIKGYFDENCYFNSPAHFLPNLEDNYWLSHLQNKKHIYLVSGTGEGEFPHNVENMSNILTAKEIRHEKIIEEGNHNFDFWKPILRRILETKF